MANPVEGRVIVEVTKRHAIIYRTDGKGFVVDNEVFAWPFPLSRPEAELENKDIWDVVYDYLNSVCNTDSSESARGGD